MSKSKFEEETGISKLAVTVFICTLLFALAFSFAIGGDGGLLDMSFVVML